MAGAILTTQGVGKTFAQSGGEENEQPCEPEPDIISSVYYQGHTFPAVVMTKIGANLTWNSARYKAQGNDAKDLVVSIDRKWQWINGYATFSCTVLWFVNVYTSLKIEGQVVPYGTEEDSELVHDLPGGTTVGGPTEAGDDQWYLCWYTRYPDGSRSPYYYCEQVK